MFGIGMPEMILILAVALIVIGPNKLPDLAKSLGRALGEFKKATRELKDSINMDDEIGSINASFDTLKHDIEVTADPTPIGDDPTSAATVEGVSPKGESGKDPSKETEPPSSMAHDTPPPPSAIDTRSPDGEEEGSIDKNGPAGSIKDG